MLKFYYHPLSPIARRVWLALLEKDISFEPVVVDLRGRENLQPEYLALNPFHHVPVMVDGTFRILESFAILDYLEAKFPRPALLPGEPTAIATTRMVQMVVANELVTKLPLLAANSDNPQTDLATFDHVQTVLRFLAGHLGTATYFGGDRLSLADITAGAAIPLISRLGVRLDSYPTLQAWCDRLQQRPAWQQTEPGEEALQIWKRWISLMVKRHQQRLQRS